jgi:hypothetical protein
MGPCFLAKLGVACKLPGFLNFTGSTRTLVQKAEESDSLQHMRGDPWDQNAAGVIHLSIVE